MESIRFACNKCGQHLEADADMAGSKIFCPKCAIEITVPAEGSIHADINTEPLKHSPPAPPEKSAEKIVRPDLFWRRIASIIVDLLFFYLLTDIIIKKTGTLFFGTLLGLFASFLPWFYLHLKHDTSVGKFIVQIKTKKNQDSKGEKATYLLVRFAVTWLPFFILLFMVFEPALTESLITGLCLVALIVWFFANVLSFFITKGKKGIHDFICHTTTDLSKPEFLSAPRKIIASLASVYFVYILAANIMGFAQTPDSTLTTAQTSFSDFKYDPNANYNAQQIQSLYKDRVFEVVTRWKQPGGFLWLDTVDAGSQGSAIMVRNNENYGLLVSNWHVVEPSRSMSGGYECMVRRSPNEEYVESFLIAKGKYFDLALILVEVIDWEPVTVPWAPINTIYQGENAVAVGNTLGYGISVTDGLISMIEGNIGSQIIRTSTPVSPGNSGGPLFLQRGALLAGIVTAQHPSHRAQNVNYAIPAEYIWDPRSWEFFVDDPSAVREIVDILTGR